MKIALSILVCLFISAATYSQTTPAVQLASKIADRMKDSLGLNQNKRNQIYDINMKLHQQKKEVLQNFQNRDSIARKLQRIELRRDSLYQKKLTDQQFQLYLAKKKNIINNN